jgi:hypothetical protein
MPTTALASSVSDRGAQIRQILGMESEILRESEITPTLTGQLLGSFGIELLIIPGMIIQF